MKEKLWVKDTKKLEKIILKLKTKKKIERVLLNPDSHLDQIIQYYKSQKSIKRRCETGAITLNISPYGDLIFCGEVNDLGNIKKEDPKKIWNSKEMIKARKHMKWCNKCILNCHYTPTMIDLMKDFIFRPIRFKLGI